MTGSRTVVALVVASVLGLATAITAHAAEPEPEAPRWGLFVDAEREVGSGMVAVDRQDGIHIAYSHRAPLAEDPTAGWLYCPVDAACGSGEGWIGTELGTNVLRVMLATTRVGAPRLLIEQSGTNGGKDYHYAAYDTDCGNPASWQVGFVTRTWGTEIGDAFLETHTRHGFALDDQDRPGFVFDDRDYLREPDHVGGFYTWCETACAAGTPESPTWREVDIGGGAPGDRDIYSLPALRYTSSGRPRVLVEVTTGDAGAAPMGIVYKTCDTDCDQSASWTHTPIADRGYEMDVSWDLVLDADDRAHVALYQGSLLDAQGHRLFPLTCTIDCDDAGSWRTLDLGLERGQGESPDIELQPDGRPAISYLRGGSAVQLLRCIADCADAGGWRNSVLDTATDLETDFPVAHPVTCEAGFWDTESTRLAIDSRGHLRVVADAAYQARCLYEDPKRPDDPPMSRFHEVHHAVRLLLWDVPPLA